MTETGKAEEAKPTAPETENKEQPIQSAAAQTTAAMAAKLMESLKAKGPQTEFPVVKNAAVKEGDLLPSFTLSYGDKQLVPTLMKYMQFHKMAGASQVELATLADQIATIKLWQENNKDLVK